MGLKDDLLSYRTTKWVVIRDWRLGALAYSLQVAILSRIIIVGVLQHNIHLKVDPVYGSARASTRAPTVCESFDPDVNCRADYTPIGQLPYCSQCAAKMRLPSENEAATVHSCQYWDGVTMQLGRTPMPGIFFLPTRYTKTKQKKGCDPSEDNGWKCHTHLFEDDEDEEPEVFYIADVERYTLRLSHAFESAGVDVKGDSRDSRGILDPIDSDGTYIIGSEPDNSSAFPNAYSQSDGSDVITVGEILKLADWSGAELLDTLRQDNTTVRFSGAVVPVTVHYSNAKLWDPLGHAAPHYRLKALVLPMHEYAVMYDVQDVEGGGRVVHDVHGLLFVFILNGGIRSFDSNYMLQVLTTAMVSLALAATLTDNIMMYCLRDAPKYTILKYQPSQDFGKLKKNVEMLQEHHKDKYDPLTHKPQPHAEYLNDLAEMKTPEPPTGEELLLVLLKFEQRLNRLDAMDEHNAVAQEGTSKMEPSLAFIKKMEDRYTQKLILRRQSSVPEDHPDPECEEDTKDSSRCLISAPVV